MDGVPMIWRNSLKRLPTIDTITMRIEQRTKKVQSQKSIFLLQFSTKFIERQEHIGPRIIPIQEKVVKKVRILPFLFHKYFCTFGFLSL